MSSRFRELLLPVLLASAATACGATNAHLRVCADPNNLPFSNRAQEGFENRIASLIASELHADVEYTWWAQRRGFVRNTLNEHKCDIIMGVPSSFELALTSRPYYRSTYVFVSRADRALELSSLDDPRLRDLRIGVQIVGDDYASTPPAHALANRGMTRNIVGYSVYGDYRQPNPPARIIDGVANGDVDVALVWGPLAGYFAQRAGTPLHLAAVTPHIDPPFLPMVFDISMAVRRADTVLNRRINELLVEKRAEIDAILREYNVPRVESPVARAAL